MLFIFQEGEFYAIWIIGEHLGHSFSKMIHEKVWLLSLRFKKRSQKDHIVEYFKEHPFKRNQCDDSL